MKNEKETSPSVVSLLLLLLVLVTAGVIILKDKTEIEQLKQQQLTLNETLEVRDSVINEMLNTFGQIEQNLSFVKNKRNEMISLVQESGKSWQEILVADVRLMNYLLEISSRQTEERINELQLAQFKSEIDQRTYTAEIKPQIIASKTFTFFE